MASITVEDLVRLGVKSHTKGNKGSPSVTQSRKNRKWKLTPKQTFEARFWSKIKKRRTDQCWPWLGHCSDRGYGMIYADYDQLYSHRIAYIIGKGKIPDNLFVLHECDNPPCCNPRHLFLGTQMDNVHDCHKKKRHWVAHGEGHYKSKLTALDVKAIRENPPTGTDAKAAIAKKYGIHLSHLTSLLNRSRWGWLK